MSATFHLFNDSGLYQVFILSNMVVYEYIYSLNGSR